MSKKRIAPEAGWVTPKKLPVGPNGRALCRRCGQEVSQGRRTFCSDACVHEHKIRTDPGYVRQQVFQRDRGVCAVCGLDTVVEEQQIAKKLNAAKTAWVQHRGDSAERLQLHGFWELRKQEFRARLGAELGGRRTAGYWDADHIVPVSQDGGGCGLDNYRTLCIPCHKQATAALRKQQAAARRKLRNKEC